MSERFATLRPHAAGVLLRRLTDPVQRKGECRPKVRIDTAQGFRYEGTVLSIEDRPHGCAVLLEHERVGESTSILSYLTLYDPFHISIFDADAFVNLLRFGELTRWSDDAALSGLQTKRAFERTRTRLASAGLELSGVDALIVKSGLENNVVRDLTVALDEYVATTRTDTAGAEALLAIRTLALRFAEHSTPRVARDGTVLTIELDPKAGLDDKARFFSLLDQQL
jgi:hypothetical protein